MDADELVKILMFKSAVLKLARTKGHDRGGWIYKLDCYRSRSTDEISIVTGYRAFGSFDRNCLLVNCWLLDSKNSHK